tara:strand:+ start:1572 stop:1781 length:210 start_codon:yes stop_codon:yes gene_type:complete
MSNKENITASINGSLKRKLTSELKGANKAETKQQASNVSFTNLRRTVQDRAENKALADELGVTVTELEN